MAIRIQCEQCGKTATVPEQHAGKRAKCPCGAIMKIPAQAPGAGEAQQPSEQRKAPATGWPQATGARTSARTAPGRRTRRGMPGRTQLSPRGNKLRNALLGVGVAVLIAALVGIVLVTRDRTIKPSAIAVNPLKVVPEGTGALAYVNLKELVASGMVDEHIQPPEGDDPAFGPNAIIDSLNLAPDKDLDSALFIAGSDWGKTAVVVTGRFRTQAIDDYVKQNRWKEDYYKGLKFAEIGDNRLCALGGGVVLFGEKSIVEKIADVITRNAKAMDRKSPLMKKARRFYDETFWLLAKLDGEQLAASADQQAIPLPQVDMSKLQSLALRGKVSRGNLDLTLELGCESTSVAIDLSKELKKAKGKLSGAVLLMGRGDDQAVKLVDRFLRSIRIDSQSSDAIIRFKLEQALVDMATEMATKMIPAPEPPETGDTPPAEDPGTDTPPTGGRLPLGDTRSDDEPDDIDEDDDGAGVQEDLDAPASVGLSRSFILPVYDRDLKDEKRIIGFDLGTCGIVAVRTAAARLAAGAAPAEIFAKARQGHVYFTGNGFLVPVRGTKICALSMKGWERERLHLPAFKQHLGETTMRELLDQIAARDKSEPEHAVASLQVAADKSYLLSTTDGGLTAILISSRLPGKLSLTLLPIGWTSICQANLTEIGTGCKDYLREKGDGKRYPPTLQELLGPQFVFESHLACPADEGAEGQRRCSYTYLFDITDKEISAGELPFDLMLAWDNRPRHGGGRCVVYVDGYVEKLSRAAFKARLAELKTYLAEVGAGE